jgi:predicted Zn finger-like uncharacterized protein
MILTCPQCATRYQIEDSKFPPGGRKVRCAKCAHQWFQQPPAPEPEIGVTATGEEVSPPPPAQPAPAAPQPSPDELRRSTLSAAPAAPAAPASTAAATAPAKPRGERTAIAAGWIGLAAILFLIVWGGVRYRDTIASVWPQTSSMYALLGMPVNARGLAFTEVNYRRNIEAGQQVLTVNGNVVNVSSRELAVPEIAVTLTDNDKRQLDRWVFSSGVSRLKPGQKIAFATRRTNPPEDARHLEMTFAGPHS